jgi:N-acetyl-gamma-glutamyl-phosphate reductase
MRPKVYVDGHAGTTGLRIREWLQRREDLELLTLPESVRKSSEARREQILAADLAVLCLPDEAAREAAGWVEAGGSPVRLVDASTAHRVAAGWVFGLPELCADQRDAIRDAQRVSNPGCYSSAFILLVRPLVDAGLLATDTPLTIHALSGYSGGGRTLIERWEEESAGLRSLVYEAPYALERVHKHIPEMMRYAELRREPQFVPAVGPFLRGMRVEVPLHADLLHAGGGRENGKSAWEILTRRYHGEPFVQVMPALEAATHERSFDPQACNDSNRIELHVCPHPSGHVLLLAVLDNLGKGASGVAIQCINLMLGCPETLGLRA